MGVVSPDPFSPLDGSAGASTPKKADAWVIVAPVPSDAPAPPAAHPKLGRPGRTWVYGDPGGAVLGYALRFDTADGKEFRPLTLWRSAKDDALAWRWEAWPAPRPLYGLDRLAERPKAPVIVTEGEKAAEAAGRMLPDHVVVTSPNGAKSARKADWRPLTGRAVVIWPDADEPGAAYAATVAEIVAATGAASVAVLALPDGVADGWDAADAEAEGMTPAAALALVKGAVAVGKASADMAEPQYPRGRRRPPQRDQIMRFADDVELFRDEAGEAYATFPVGDHHENWPVRSRSFKNWLSARNYRETGYAAGAQAIEDAIRVMEAIAAEGGEEISPALRVGQASGRIYIDLCDKSWRAIEIGPDGWSVVDRPGVKFVRSPAMRPLPAPEAGSEVDLLRRFANVEDEASFILVVAWMLAALRGQGPYPILTLNGEQGTGKSTFSRLLRSLTDPSAAPIRAAPRDDRDLIVAAINAHEIVVDNMSRVEPWLADALCRLATGGGFSTRQLHTDKEEMVFMATRPILLNGIPSLTDRPDLADRSLVVRLRPIAREERRPEDEFWSDWAETAPKVLGALCDALSTALRRVAGVKLTESGRMADFEKWISAAEPGLGWPPGTFAAAYSANRAEVSESTFTADPVATAIANLVRNDYPSGWNGTPTELLDALNTRASDTMRRSRMWPQSAQGLGNRLDRIAPLLRSQGFVVERRHSGSRLIAIVPMPAPPAG